MKNSAVVSSTQEACTSPLVLALPKHGSLYALDTDGYDRQIRCVLRPDQDEATNCAVGSWFWKLKDKKQKLTTTPCECLAIVWTVGLLSLYLKRKPSTIWTDHWTQRWILTTTEAACQLPWWHSRLSAFEINMVQKAGMKHQAADALPRNKTESENETTMDDEFHLLTIFQALFACAPRTKSTHFDFLEEPESTFVLLIPGI